MTRRRNFEGCWTCRSRKVKCDLQKPHCQRCTKAGLDCAGFDIKLAWAPPLTVSSHDRSLVSLGGDEDKSDFQRRNVELVKFPPHMLYTTYSELNRRLDRLEAQALAKRTGRVGPFGVYDARRRARRQKGAGGVLSVHLPIRTVQVHTKASGHHTKASADRITTTTTTTTRSDTSSSPPSPPSPPLPPYKRESIFSRNNNSWVHYELMEHAKLTIVAIKGTAHRFTEQNVLHILYPKFFPNLDSDDDWMADIRITHKLFFMDEHADLWLKGAFKVLACAVGPDLFTFNRVAFSHNYIDTLVIPYLMSVFCEFICCEFTNWNSSDLHLTDNSSRGFSRSALRKNIKLAIVYLVLGLSSFKMSLRAQTPPGDHLELPMDDHLKMSVELRKLSISILNYHLDEYDNNSLELDQCERDDQRLEYEDMLLLAVIMQIELDNCFSVYENFELIYAIGDYIVKNKYTKARMTHFRRLLINMFRIMYMFFESTQSVNMFNYAISEGDENANYRDLSENYDLAAAMAGAPKKRKVERFVPKAHFTTSVDMDTLHMMYGLPGSLLDLFHEIVHLTNHKNIFQRKRVFPRNFPKICAEIEDKLIGWRVEHYWDLDLENNPMHRCLDLGILAFHEALIVYHKRLIKEQVSGPAYQAHVRKAIGYLQEMTRLSDQNNIKLRPTFWILLVCGSEATEKEDQKLIEALWKTPGFSQFNYWRGKQILYEIWKRRDLGEEFGFMDMVREWDVVLSLG
ncbi:uncharacterized protein CANTADRAFT_51867 [Suhomyces tanzawaensis NRRL Y-17324]|uniref:Zn(2)-C6 fungal-type domain-containing protein n=1 Tax=Suhomyces tanzawaensis NRRL Y-17324 TaxID=984487 RepID=A0A1E4SHJ7_9ASCO|nr:uncharacterized protein CANTADRAFT_51867 [Suhomyces tanzawaensis NRRL Y-17324]ODV78966.1 hypothetical protein CANTADRAFT_51867 [Suhomyces tanzawaensis NRRL Y-17324]